MRRFTRNDFLAFPESFHGGVTGGVETHPGFHTAEYVETTYAYAQQKAVPDDLDEELDKWGPSGLKLNDYPVVVTLDMQGLQRLPDYDDEKLIRDDLVTIAGEMLLHQQQEGVSAHDAARWFCDTDETPVDEHHYGYGVVQWLFAIGARVMQAPTCALSSYVEDIEDEAQAQRFLQQLAKGKIAPDALATIGGQYRYLEDVSTDRIVSIDYLVPIYPRMFEAYGDEDDSELVEELEDAGWAAWRLDDAYSGAIPDDTVRVYERKAPSGARIEYHGTTYRNLMLAAPELRLPVPPPPYDPMSHWNR